MTVVRPTISTLVDQARAAESASGATISRAEAVGILATAREMHLNRADVEAALVAAGFSAPAALTDGDVARRARQDESALAMIGYPPGRIDGRGGATLEAAVRNFQHDYGLPETGVIDASTRQGLEDMVATNQAMLATLGAPIEIDGVAGPATTAAVRAFQRDHHLPVTGHCDARTTEALGQAYQQDRDTGTVDREWAVGRMAEVRGRIEGLTTHARVPLSFDQLVGATRAQLADLVEAGAISRELATAANAYRGLANSIRNFDNSAPGSGAMLHMMRQASESASALVPTLSLPT